MHTVVAGAFDQPSRATRQNAQMKTLDDMRQRRLLSAEQHANITAWVAGCDGPEAIMAMPSDLWRALSMVGKGGAWFRSQTSLSRASERAAGAAL